MSLIWVLEYVRNKATELIFKRTFFKAEIPLNVTGQVVSRSGLTWDKLSHTFDFGKNMTKNWETNINGNLLF